ncbi:MAG: metallophosphoesterase [Planctomycetota bacterium]
MKRRDVIKGGVALAAGWVGPAAVGQSLRPEEGDTGPWVALLSDTHLDTNPRRWLRGVRTARAFASVLGRLGTGEAGPPAAVLINGDVAHAGGQRGDYETLRETVDAAGPSLRPIHYSPGNHDHREHMREAGLVPAPFFAEGKACRVVRVAGVDWVLLDSLRRRREVAGALGEAQLAWLGEQLDAGPVDRPAFVLSHHPPGDPKGGRENRVGLADGRALLDLLWDRPRVKALFHGHLHKFEQREVNGMHVVGQPSTAYVFGREDTPGYLEARVRPDHLELTRRAVSPDGPNEGEVVRLTFR